MTWKVIPNPTQDFLHLGGSTWNPRQAACKSRSALWRSCSFAKLPPTKVETSSSLKPRFLHQQWHNSCTKQKSAVPMLEDMQKKPLASLCFSLTTNNHRRMRRLCAVCTWVVGFLLLVLLLLLENSDKQWRQWQQRPRQKRKRPPLQGEQYVYSLSRSPFVTQKWRRRRRTNGPSIL